MTPRQIKFVAEYIQSGNATEAAKAAGYKERSAYSTGSRMLRNAEISEAISKAKNEARQDGVLTRAAALQLLSEIATGAKTEYARLRAVEILARLENWETATDKSDVTLKVVYGDPGGGETATTAAIPAAAKRRPEPERPAHEAAAAQPAAALKWQPKAELIRG